MIGFPKEVSHLNAGSISGREFIFCWVLIRIESNSTFYLNIQRKARTVYSESCLSPQCSFQLNILKPVVSPKTEIPLPQLKIRVLTFGFASYTGNQYIFVQQSEQGISARCPSDI